MQRIYMAWRKTERLLRCKQSRGLQFESQGPKIQVIDFQGVKSNTSYNTIAQTVQISSAYDEITMFALCLDRSSLLRVVTS
jgi:hypothetical protein